MYLSKLYSKYKSLPFIKWIPVWAGVLSRLETLAAADDDVVAEVLFWIVFVLLLKIKERLNIILT